jgi:sugar lactone lactonase YvrE
MRITRARTLAVAVALVAMGTATAPATAATNDDHVSGSEGGAPVQRLLSLDATASQFPEGVAVGPDGTIYFSLIAPVGEVRSLDTRGHQRTVASLPHDGGPGPIGLTVDAQGTVYVAVATADAATRGVYRVASDGATTRLPGTGDISGTPNGLALDDRGSLYVTDSTVGAVWRVPAGGAAQLWLQDAQLVGNGSSPPPFPVGANGIAYRNGALYVANTELGSLVTVPVKADGSAGIPRTLLRTIALYGADGLTFDSAGNLYVAVFSQNMIVRMAPDLSLTTLATATDGLDLPSSLSVGVRPDGARTLYAVNLAVGPEFGLPQGAGPAVLKLQLSGLRSR